MRSCVHERVTQVLLKANRLTFDTSSAAVSTALTRLEEVKGKAADFVVKAKAKETAHAGKDGDGDGEDGSDANDARTGSGETKEDLLI